MVLMTFSICAFPTRKSAIQDLPGHGASMRVGVCLGILFPQPLYVHEFVRGIKVQDLNDWTLFDSGLSFVAKRGLQFLNWVADGCFGSYHYEFRSDVVQ